MQKVKSQNPKLLVLGLDGANWQLIEPWLESGILPNVEYVRTHGCYAVQKSQLPPVTFPNWRCYSTGKNPGKLGVFWFEVFDRKTRMLRSPTSESFKGAQIWDYLNAQGIKTGVINMPTTYPPKKIDGFLIAGGPLCKDTGYTYPASLEKELTDRYDYRKGLQNPIDPSSLSNPSVDEALELIDMRFRVAMDLWRENQDMDFLHLTIFYINVLQHHFYRDEPVLKGWKIIDRYLGEFLEKDITVFLVSDHGCDKVDDVFYVNTWLQEQGYLKIQKPVFGEVMKTLRIDKKKLKKFISKAGLKKLKQVVPSAIKKQIPTEKDIYGYKQKHELIDWNGTKAFASAQGIIYVNAKRGTAEYECIREEIKAGLETLRVPQSQKVVAANIYNGEDVYTAEDSGTLPDIVFEQGRGIHTNGDIGSKVVFDVPKKWKAENIQDGIFAAVGPDIKANFNKGTSSITDVAPTILHLMGIPVPEDMDGHVMTDIFQEGAAFAQKEIKYQKPLAAESETDGERQMDEEIVRQQLRQLGYVE